MVETPLPFFVHYDTDGVPARRIVNLVLCSPINNGCFTEDEINDET